MARDLTRGVTVRNHKGHFTKRTTPPKKLVSASRDPQRSLTTTTTSQPGVAPITTTKFVTTEKEQP